MVRENNKGFTLVELLATIVIITLIMGIGIPYLINTINESKSKSNELAINNAMNSAAYYVKENDYNIIWTPVKDNNGYTGDYFTCVELNDLVNKGYIKNNEAMHLLDINENKRNIVIKKDSNGVITEDGFNDDLCVNGRYNIVPFPSVKKICRNPEYTGENVRIVDQSDTRYRFNDSEIIKKDVGSYEVNVSLNDELNEEQVKLVWPDGTDEVKKINCSVTKGIADVRFNPTAISSTITRVSEATITSNIAGSVSLKSSNSEYVTVSFKDNNNTLVKTGDHYEKVVLINNKSSRNTTTIVTATVNPVDKNNYYSGSARLIISDIKKEKVDKPNASICNTLYYNGNEQRLVNNPDGEKYYIRTEDNKITKKDIGKYKMIVRLNYGYVWSDNTTSDLDNIYCEIKSNVVKVNFKCNYNNCGNDIIKQYTVGVSNQAFTSNGTSSGTAIFTRTGYTGSGWASSSNGSKVYNWTSGVNDTFIKNNVGGTVTLYALWDANKYVINYYQGNGTTTGTSTKIGNSTCTYNSSCILKKYVDFGKTLPVSSKINSSDCDYVWSFYGWSDTQTGLTRKYINGATFTYNTASDINLYVLEYRNIAFSTGLAPTSAFNSQVQYWNPYSSSDSYLTSITIPKSSGTMPTGWTFIGYKGGSNAANATVNYTAAQASSGTLSIKPSVYQCKANRSIYSRTVSISYTGNGNTGGSAPAASTTTQYYNGGWFSGGTNTGAANVSTPTFTLANNTFTKAGHVFSKWSIGNAGSSYTGFVPAVSATNTTSTSAVWSANKYVINYYQGNGTTTAGSTKIGSSTCTYGSSCILKKYADFGKTIPFSVKDTNIAGCDYVWSFHGWGTGQTGTIRSYADGATFNYSLTSDLNLYVIAKRPIWFVGGLSPTEAFYTTTQYWNPYSTADTYLSSITLPKSNGSISGWEFIGYRAGTNAANSIVDYTATQANGESSVKPSVTQCKSYRSMYKRTVSISYTGNGNTGGSAPSASTATQYYNSGWTNGGAAVSNPTFTLANNTFTKTGHVFSKWSVGNAGASYTGFVPAVSATNTTSTNAVWTSNKLSIIYNVNGATMNATHGEGYSIKSNIVYKDNAVYTQEYDYIDANTTIVSTGLTNYNNGSYINVSKVGYHVDSGAIWTYGGKDFDQGTAYKLTDIDANIKTKNVSATMTLNWKANTYKVKYNCNGDSGSIADVNATYGINITLSDGSVCKKTGYTFSGWNTKADGSGTSYGKSASVKNLTTTNNGTVTLYGKWDANKYVINYYQGNGTTTAGSTKIGSSTCTYGSSCILKKYADFGKTIPFSVKDTNIAGCDYVWGFYGWGTGQTGTIRSYADGATFNYSLTSDLNLYVIAKRTIWFVGGLSPTEAFYTTTQYWNPYSTADTYLSSITLPKPNGSISGWEFIGYRTGTNAANSTVDYTATQANGESSVKPSVTQCKSYRSMYKRTVSISYTGNGNTGGSAPAKSTTTQYYNSGWTNGGAAVSNPTFTLANNTFTKTGHVFSKWSVGNAGATYTGFKPAVSATNTTSTNAVWISNKLSINYNVNGATMNATHGESYSIKSNIVYKDNAVYTQEYEYTDANTTIVSTGLTNYNNDSYINVSKAGYHVDSGAIWTYGGKNFDQGTAYKLTDIDANIKTKNVSATMTLNWKANTYKVKYNCNGDSGSIADVNATYGSNITLSDGSVCKKTGYTFSGWNTKADGSGTSYEKSASVKNLTTTNNGTVTLYGKWTPNVCTIKFTTGGGTFTNTSLATTRNVNYGKNVNLYNVTGSGTTSYSSVYAGHTPLSDHEWIVTDYNGGATGLSISSNLGGVSPSYDHGATYNITDLCTNLANASGTVTLAVNWRLNVCTVNYSPNGGKFNTSTPTERKTQYGQSITLSKPDASGSDGYDASKPGYTVGSSWVNGNGTYSTSSAVKATTLCSNLATGDQSVTLNANWTKACYSDGTRGYNKFSDMSPINNKVITVMKNCTDTSGATFNTSASKSSTLYINGNTLTKNSSPIYVTGGTLIIRGNKETDKPPGTLKTTDSTLLVADGGMLWLASNSGTFTSSADKDLIQVTNKAGSTMTIGGGKIFKNSGSGKVIRTYAGVNITGGYICSALDEATVLVGGGSVHTGILRFHGGHIVNLGSGPAISNYSNEETACHETVIDDVETCIPHSVWLNSSGTITSVNGYTLVNHASSAGIHSTDNFVGSVVSYGNSVLYTSSYWTTMAKGTIGYINAQKYPIAAGKTDRISYRNATLDNVSVSSISGICTGTYDGDFKGRTSNLNAAGTGATAMSGGKGYCFGYLCNSK